MQKPDWMRIKVKPGAMQCTISKINGLTTVCEEAACPNLSDCWSRGHATFMILGKVCTRNCKFCNVRTGKGNTIDPDEPQKIAESILQLKLRHVVITSVARDDLKDGGAQHFVDVITKIREISPKTSIEILTPDFLYKNNAEDIIIDVKPEIFGHNIESVPSVYRKIRPGGSYIRSLELLKRVKDINQNIITKSAMMVGLGESMKEIFGVMDDLRSVNVDFFSVGQYLQPSINHYHVQRYLELEEYDIIKAEAYKKGFSVVCAFPFARSSYMADDAYDKYIKNKIQ